MLEVLTSHLSDWLQKLFQLSFLPLQCNNGFFENLYLCLNCFNIRINCCNQSFELPCKSPYCFLRCFLLCSLRGGPAEYLGPFDRPALIVVVAGPNDLDGPRRLGLVKMAPTDFNDTAFRGVRFVVLFAYDLDLAFECFSARLVAEANGVSCGFGETVGKLYK